MKWRIRLEHTLTEEAEVKVEAPDEEGAYDEARDSVMPEDWHTVRVHASDYDAEPIEPPDGYKGGGVFADNH